MSIMIAGNKRKNSMKIEIADPFFMKVLNANAVALMANPPTRVMAKLNNTIPPSMEPFCDTVTKDTIAYASANTKI
jgi:hypothetical protein